MEQLIILSLIAGGINLDTRAAFQFMISRPIISGPVIGYFLGELEFGLMAGIFLELLWINVIPMGAAIPPETSLSGMLAVSLAIMCDRPSLEGAFILAILYAVLCSSVFRWSDITLRRLNTYWAHFLDRKMERGGLSWVDAVIYFGVITVFLQGAVLFYLLVRTGLFLINNIPPSPWLEEALKHVYSYFPAMGLGIVFSAFWVKPEKYPFLGK